MCDSGQGRKIQNRNNVAPLRSNTGAGHNNLIKIKPVLTPDRKQKSQHGRRKKNHNEPMFTLTKQDIHGVEITKNYIQWDISGKGYKSQQDRAFYENGIMGTIPICRTENKINILVQNNIRRLTPIECARLQGFPDSWCDNLSDTQAYKCFGNSVSVPVVKTIASRIKEVFIDNPDKEINL
jgi:DNA (cytosine-5)-methyltransferase 1